MLREWLCRILMIACLGPLCAAAGCGKSAPPLPPDGTVRSIVSLSPGTTEALFALGLGDRVVAVSSADDFPPEVKDLPRVGGLNTPNVEALLALKPDLVVATGIHPHATEATIRNRGLRLLLLPQNSLADVYDAILALGEATGAETKARELVADMRRREAEVAARVAVAPPDRRPSIFVLLQAEPVYTAGPDALVSEIIRKAGGRNAADSLKQQYAQVSAEFVIKANPDHILLTHGSKEAGEAMAKEIAGRIGWGRVTAVREGNLIADIHPDLLLRPGPRVIRGLELLTERLHPSNPSKATSETPMELPAENPAKNPAESPATE